MIRIFLILLIIMLSFLDTWSTLWVTGGDPMAEMNPLMRTLWMEYGVAGLIIPKIASVIGWLFLYIVVSVAITKNWFVEKYGNNWRGYLPLIVFFVVSVPLAGLGFFHNMIYNWDFVLWKFGY